MGCAASTNNVVKPLPPEVQEGDEDDTGSKHSNRGDSAVSKVTTDSGVVMENREIPEVPGILPRRLPPLIPNTESEGRVNVQDASLSFLQQTSAEPKSSEILGEPLTRAIFPDRQPKQKGSIAWEAYSIMLEDTKGPQRRPPARLKSLKAWKEQNSPSKEAMEQKIRQVEERRKLREDKFKTLMRAQSACVRPPVPASFAKNKEDPTVTPVEPLQLTSVPEPTGTPKNSKHFQVLLHIQAAEDGDLTREGEEDDREWSRAVGAADERGQVHEEAASRDPKQQQKKGQNGSEDDGELKEEENVEFHLLTASVELESDSTFQHVKDNDETF
ncbi:uncharacterized protein stmnd1 [Thalassophryne amazonica]|uniref:uncharacterized protein stmnd1 n=1 Tax=Thalassophryne amazonica TaxID=390379 RepID=UPI001470A249|nr:uncharacterized protein stmnd1 [Thalassophryne amazonica]